MSSHGPVLHGRELQPVVAGESWHLGAPTSGSQLYLPLFELDTPDELALLCTRVEL